MKQLAFGISGDYAQLTGGYAYDRRVLAELRDLGWDAEFLDVGSGFPRPDAATHAGALARLAAVVAGTPLMIDGLVFGVLGGAVASLRARHPLVALVHHPLALETGWSAEEEGAFRASERAALAAAHQVVATSRTTGDILRARYDVDDDRLTVAVPGQDAMAFAPGSSDGIVRLIAVGSLVPRKGHDVLVAALAELTDLPWRLIIAGDPDRHQPTTQALARAVARHGLGDRIDIVGGIQPERLVELYRGADLFVLASHYEGYGMAYVEAVAHGLPVIGTTGGAIPEAVPEGTGILVPPGDVVALRAALRRLVADAGERRRFAGAARAASARLPRWRETAERVAHALARASGEAVA